MALGSASWKIKDFANQSSNFQVNTDEITAANIATITPQIAALQTAIDGICIGNINTATTVATVDEISTAKASDPSARRELKWLCTMVDSVNGKQESREMPCPDVNTAANFESDGESLNLAVNPGLAFKTALQAVAVSADGNSVILTKVRLVGRNL